MIPTFYLICSIQIHCLNTLKRSQEDRRIPDMQKDSSKTKLCMLVNVHQPKMYLCFPFCISDHFRRSPIMNMPWKNMSFSRVLLSTVQHNSICYRLRRYDSNTQAAINSLSLDINTFCFCLTQHWVVSNSWYNIEFET